MLVSQLTWDTMPVQYAVSSLTVTTRHLIQTTRRRFANLLNSVLISSRSNQVLTNKKVGFVIGTDLFCIIFCLFLYVLESFANLSLDLVAELNVVTEECLHCLASLSKFAFAVAEP